MSNHDPVLVETIQNHLLKSVEGGIPAKQLAIAAIDAYHHHLDSTTETDLNTALLITMQNLWSGVDHQSMVDDFVALLRQQGWTFNRISANKNG